MGLQLPLLRLAVQSDPFLKASNSIFGSAQLLKGRADAVEHQACMGKIITCQEYPQALLVMREGLRESAGLPGEDAERIVQFSLPGRVTGFLGEPERFPKARARPVVIPLAAGHPPQSLERFTLPVDAGGAMAQSPDPLPRDMRGRIPPLALMDERQRAAQQRLCLRIL